MKENEKKCCKDCSVSGKCKYENLFKHEKINSCPDFKFKRK